MNIKYVIIKEKGIVKAYPVVEGEYAEGIDPNVAETLIEKHGVSKKSLMIPKNLVGIAKLHPEDVYDEEVGKDIARDKLLIAYNRELLKALDVYSKGLIRMLAITHSRAKASKNKIDNARNRINQ